MEANMSEKGEEEKSVHVAVERKRYLWRWHTMVKNYFAVVAIILSHLLTLRTALSLGA